MKKKNNSKLFSKPIINRMFKSNEEKIEYIQKTIVDKFRKFPLKEYLSKNPSWKFSSAYASQSWDDCHQTGHKGWGFRQGPKPNGNGTMLVDLDIYNWGDDHPFWLLCKKEDFEDYLESLDTYIQKTGNGGYHLIFEFTEELRTVDNHEVSVDLKNKVNSYCVGAGTKIKRSKGKKEDIGKISQYHIWERSGIKINKISEELKNWLILYQQKTGPKKRVSIAKLKKEIKGLSSKSEGSDNDNTHYSWKISEAQLCELLKNTQEDTWTEFKEYFKMTTALKTMGKYKIWKHYTKQLVDKKHLRPESSWSIYGDTIWNKINVEGKGTNRIVWDFFIRNDSKNLLNHIKYKKAPENKFREGAIIINREKLALNLNLDCDEGYVDCNNFDDVYIRSDTGTGKTTLVKRYISDKAQARVVSIVSRVSLADTQYNEFSKMGIDCYHYDLCKEDKYYYRNGDNVIITIESIHRIDDIADHANDYIVFLDEFDSLLKHLIKSPTVKNRAMIWMILRKLLRNCNQIIATDADIHSNRMKFINDLDRKYQKVLNVYKHYEKQKVMMKEHFSFSSIIGNMKQDVAMNICCDSKKDAEVTWSKILKFYAIVWDLKTTKYEIDGKIYALYTSDEKRVDDLDDNFVNVFSPKIIYGMDSIKPRRVFCNYKEHTIGPTAMHQQIARSRNITQLDYIFYKKEFQEEKYTCPEDVKEEYHDYKKLSLPIKCTLPECESKLYEEMLCDLEYEEDCYNTNKALHFKIIAEEKGMIDEESIIQRSSTLELDIESNILEKEKKDNFDPTDQKHQDLNAYLEFPEEVMIENKDIFLKPGVYQNYKNTCRYFFKGNTDWINNLKFRQDFMINKILDKAHNNQFRFVVETLKKFGISDKTSLIPQKNIGAEVSKEIQSTYKKLFRDRCKDSFDLTKPYEVTKFIVKIYRKLFGSKIINTKRDRIGKVKFNNYNVCVDEVYKARDLYQYKNTHINPGELDFTIDMEHTISCIGQHESSFATSLSCILNLEKCNIKKLKGGGAIRSTYYHFLLDDEPVDLLNLPYE